MAHPAVDISLWSNNQLLVDFLTKKKNEEISFVRSKEKLNFDYQAFFLDFNEELKDVSHTLLDVYMKAREKKQKLIIVLIGELEGDTEKYIYFRDLLVDIGKSQPIHRLVIAHDLYFFNETDKGVTNIDRYLDKIILSKSSEVSEKGNFNYYPLSYVDFLIAFKKILYSNYTSGENFYLQGEAVSDLEISYTLSNYCEEYLGNSIDINTTKTSKVVNHQEFGKNFIETQSKLNWKPQSDFNYDLKEFIKNYQKVEKLSTKKKKDLKDKFHDWLSVIPSISFINNNNLQTITGKILKNLLERLLFIFLSIYLFVSIIFFYTTYKSLTHLEKSLFYLRKGSIETSIFELKSSQKYHSISQYNYEILSPVIKTVSRSFNDTNQNFLTFVNYSLSTLESVHQVYSLSNKIYLSFNSTDSAQLNYQDLSLGLKSNLQQVYESINQVEILLNSNDLPSQLTQKIKQSLEYKSLKSTKDQITQVSKLADLIPLAMDTNQAKNIFFLIQNSYESRSTGGALDYVLQITLEGGRVVFKHLYSSDEIDKKDDFTVPAPPLVEKISGNSVWKLRDMNYNPNFPQTATNISWYLEKKLKVVPDLIISLNTSLIKSYFNLGKTIPISGQKIDQEKYNISSEQGNLYTKAVIEQMLNEALNHNLTLIEIGTLLSESLDTNNLNIWSKEVDAQKNIISQSFSGAARKYECHSSVSAARRCISQTNYLNISNHSLIPLNNYLSHKITHGVELGSDYINHNYNIEYSYLKSTPLTNRNLTEIYQLYTPHGSTLKSIEINDQEYTLDQVVFQKEETLDRYQFPVSTPLSLKNIIKISYTTPLFEKTVLPVAYSFTELFQGGINDSSVKLEISIPESSKVTVITAPAESKPGYLNIDLPPKNSTFGFNLVPKLQ